MMSSYSEYDVYVLAIIQYITVSAQSCLTLFDLWTAAPQAHLSIEFSRQEHRSGSSFPSLEDSPNPGIKSTFPASPVLADGFFATEPPGSWQKNTCITMYFFNWQLMTHFDINCKNLLHLRKLKSD